MPDRRRNRGPHPKDLESFSPAQLPALCHAAADLAWLLDRGYSPAAAVIPTGEVTFIAPFIYGPSADLSSAGSIVTQYSRGLPLSSVSA